MNEMPSPIWAKSSERGGGDPIRLFEHIQDVLNAFDGIKDKVKDSQLQDLIRLAIICHDFGKVLPAFQMRTLRNLNYKPSYPYHNIPHSLFSVLWIDQGKLLEEISKSMGDRVNDYLRFIVSAVAYHHWREDFVDLLSSGNRELGKLCEELEHNGFLEPLRKNLEEEIRKLGGDRSSLIRFSVEMAAGLGNGVPFSEYACPPYQLYWLPKRIEIEDHKLREWILISGFLMRSDHFASFCEEEGECFASEYQSVSLDVLKENVKTKIGEIDEKRIWQLQAIDQLRDKNVILIAPTGYGKTELAFLWSNGEKLFYTLPVRTAVNQIYERACGIFKDSSDEEKAGLLHSDADVFLLGDGGETQSSMKTYDLARQLAFPAMISTGDQFFPYALRPPGYEKIYATFSYSRLVIDEVQAYDPRAAAIVVKFMEDVVRMGGKFLLMTATLPTFIRERIDHTIGSGNYELRNLYQEKQTEFKQIKKHRIKVELIKNSTREEKPEFSVPDQNLNEVLDIALKGNRVLVIANTVKQAQDIFRRLSEKIESSSTHTVLKDKLWLLHSRFTHEDRTEKETVICDHKEKGIEGEFKNPKPEAEKIGKILVATQVVEASLDIDADVLFTEIAPLDALVQRMGRVLRRYGPLKRPEEVPTPDDPNVHVWIFQHGLQSGQHYVYDTDLVLLTLKQFKDESNGQLKEHYKDWLTEKTNSFSKTRERIEAVLQGVFGKQEHQQKKKRRRTKKSKSLEQATTESLSNEFQLTLSEYDKYALVERLYDLPEDHSYLKKFRQTKDVLDAGYMSDRLADARKIFREIYTVSVIPGQEKEQFLQAVREFFKKHHDGKRLYTFFKKEVIAKFVVSIPLKIKKIDKRQPVEWWIRDVDGINDKQRKRLLRWCQDIYFADLKYDPITGIDLETPWHSIDAAIL